MQTVKSFKSKFIAGQFENFNMRTEGHVDQVQSIIC